MAEIQKGKKKGKIKVKKRYLGIGPVTLATLLPAEWKGSRYHVVGAQAPQQPTNTFVVTFFHLFFTFHLFFHLFSTFFSPFFHLFFTFFPPCFHHLFTFFSPFTFVSPFIHLLFTFFSPFFQVLLITFFSPFFQVLILQHGHQNYHDDIHKIRLD